MTDWIERLYNLRRDKKGRHEKPHKPVVLLTVLDLVERGELTENRIPLSPELVDRYKEIFEVVRQRDDKPNPHLPLYHLSGDGFWHLVPQPGADPVYEQGNVSAPKSLRRLRHEVQWAELDPGLWGLIVQPESRRAIREALIARYFAGRREALHEILSSDPASTRMQEEQAPEEAIPGRDAAFRKTIREIYDYRCAACGIRVLLDTERPHVLIEAAHLIPWHESHNDNPTNGMALCRNHHWALDENLIAPCPSRTHKAGVWMVSSLLDDRIADHKPLVRLKNRKIIRPRDKAFLPAHEALEWRAAHLLT